MSAPDDLHALRQDALGVLDMRDTLNNHQEGAASDRVGTTEARAEGFYWIVLGRNPPEIAYWERGEWWLAGDPKPWQPEAVTVVSDRLVFKPRLMPVA